MNILNKLTKNYLKLNKKRTIVTIIGIVLAGAMISAVTTLAVSFQSFIINVEKELYGSWEAVIESVKVEDLKYIKENANFDNVMLMVPYHMAKNKYSEEEFIYIQQYDKKALEGMGIELLNGRMPEKEGEILLSSSFFDGKEGEPKIGDTVTLPIGKRMSQDGFELLGSPKEEDETFLDFGTKTYTICGIMSRPIFETSSDAYNGAITLLEGNNLQEAQTVNVGITMKNPKKIYEVCEQIEKDLNLDNTVLYNNSLLAYQGVSKNDNYNVMIYSVCGILIFVIMIGSILVIYNSFAISVSERKKQFGMLSSVGATKKQIKASVLAEGGILGIIGIPIGIGGGVIGIGITLRIVNDLLKPITGVENWNLELVISWPAIVISMLLIGLTIYMSVIIPAKRAAKITPIEAIRQSDDIKEIKPQKVKTSAFTKKLFKIEGDLALKNLKRSRKRYRTTVISLIISIVLFITVTGFTGYMFKGFDARYKTVEYDYTMTVSDTNFEDAKSITEKIEKIQQMEKYSVIMEQYAQVEIPESRLDNILKQKMQEIGEEYFGKDSKGNCNLNLKIIGLNNKEYEEYLKEVGITNLNNNQAILMNYMNALSSYHIESNLTNYQKGDILPIKMYNYEEKDYEIVNLQLASVTNKTPFGLGVNQIELIILVNQDTLQELFKKEKSNGTLRAYIKAEEKAISNKGIENQLKEIKKEYNNKTISVYNVVEDIQMQKNLKSVIQIFLYGFIVLISAIGIANIFNTISTNIQLRRREFANLKSIGMTDKSFKKMLDLECIFYGTKALVYAIPIGIFICYLLNRGFGNIFTFVFELPWSAILISIISVYAIVFITMLYASSKIKKENIIDVLRDDNI